MFPKTLLFTALTLLTLPFGLSSSHTDEVPLIPRQDLFADPDRASVQLSPEGDRLAFLAPVDGVMNVWVGPTDDPDSAEPVTDDRDRGIRAYAWAFTGEHLLYIQDQDGDENWRVYAVDLSDNSVEDLTPIDDVQARLSAVSPEHPEEIIVGLNDRTPQLHDQYRLNILTGERELVYENEGFTSFTFDRDYQLRFAQAPAQEGGAEIYQRTEEDAWELFAQVSMEDDLTTSIIGLDHAGKILYMIDSRDRDTAALVEIDLDTGEEAVLYENPQADVSNVMRHPDTRRVQAVASTFEKREWTILDDQIARELEYLETVADGEVNVANRTPDDSLWVVAYTLDNSPTRYYLYDRDAQQETFLFVNRTALEDAPLAPMHPVVIEARDGLELVSYYTLPVGSDADQNGRPDEPLPLILNVHGGPWARDNWGYNVTHQWLANRGYAVLSVNFRGSTGFGKDFINAGNREWGAAMHDDLIDAVEWAIDEGVADAERIAIMGGSYGGYAALAGLTFTPDVFAAGVSIVGPSNLITLLESIPPYWEPQVEMFAERVGDHRSEEGRELLRERSPLTHVDNIQSPLLIGQGANDPRVPKAESEQIVEAMQERDLPVTYVLYPDEGHGFARPSNRLSFNAVTEAFYAEVLGGRFEPFGNDFEGSSITVPTGAEYVSGLSEALSEE